MNLQAVVGSLARSVLVRVESLRKQAPGARMIGEMTVRYVSRDVSRRLGQLDRHKPGDDGH